MISLSSLPWPQTSEELAACWSVATCVFSATTYRVWDGLDSTSCSQVSTLLWHAMTGLEKQLCYLKKQKKQKQFKTDQKTRTSSMVFTLNWCENTSESDTNSPRSQKITQACDLCRFVCWVVAIKCFFRIELFLEGFWVKIFDKSIPVCTFFFCQVETSLHTPVHSLNQDQPQWLSDLRWLAERPEMTGPVTWNDWPSISWRVPCRLVSLS